MTTATNTQCLKTKDDFVELCRRASKYDFQALPTCTDFALVQFATLLQHDFRRWSGDLGVSCEMLESVQYILSYEMLRDELATVLFIHGEPNDDQLETTFRLLFLVAHSRHSLVTATKKRPVATASGE